MQRVGFGVISTKIYDIHHIQIRAKSTILLPD